MHLPNTTIQMWQSSFLHPHGAVMARSVFDDTVAMCYSVSPIIECFIQFDQQLLWLWLWLWLLQWQWYAEWWHW